jgi:putative glutamine amidotransferase
MASAVRKPLIGLTGRRIRGGDISAPFPFVDATLDAYMTEYAASVTGSGGIPVHLPIGISPDVLGRLDGLVLSGGGDVDPRLYGEVPGPQSGIHDPLRDAFEIGIVNAARELGMPVLGVCRGAQLINVAYGGTLVNDLAVGVGESHASYAYPREYRGHSVTFVEGSLADELYGPTTIVNSFHHQAVDLTGVGVVVTGRAKDEVVESIEVPGSPVLGVQWHPECFGGDPAFDWIVRSSTLYAGLREDAGHFGEIHIRAAQIQTEGIA